MVAYGFQSVQLLLQPTGDPTGAADAARINAAVTALGSQGGTVWLAPGNWYLAAGAVAVTRPGIWIRGAGRTATLINGTGTGDILRMYGPAFSGSPGNGGGFADLAVDGTNCGAGSAGVHVGDITGIVLDEVGVQNFSGAGSTGFHFDNNVTYTERLHGTVHSFNNTQHFVFDVTGSGASTNSFARPDLVMYVNAKPNQDGIVIQNGALPYDGTLRLRGNFDGYSSPQASAVLRITGSTPHGSITPSKLLDTYLDLQVEAGTAAGTNEPQTINLASLGNNIINGCSGILDFSQGAGTFSVANFTAAGAATSFYFNGIIRGDTALNPASPNASGNGSPYRNTAGTIFPSAFFSAGGSVYTPAGDYFGPLTLTGNLTVNLAALGGATLGVPQRKIIVIKQAASGGPYTVTWPNPGSPTTAAPAVKWAGGTAPTMTAAAGAVDVYELDTVDGATWYGRALQAAA